MTTTAAPTAGQLSRNRWMSGSSNKQVSSVAPSFKAFDRIQAIGNSSFMPTQLGRSGIHQIGQRASFSHSGIVDRSTMSLGPDRLNGLLDRISSKANKFGNYKPSMNLSWSGHSGRASGRGRYIGRGADYW